MSIESAKAFYSRITTDATFRTQFEQATTNEERQQILQASGYEFTSEEWEATKVEINGELNDAELTAISGGAGILGFPPGGIAPLYGAPIIKDPPILPPTYEAPALPPLSP